jgi:hypothetical protein
MKTWWKKYLRIVRVRHWITAAAVGLCTVLLLAGCMAASSPLRASLALEGRPALGEPFALRLELRTSMAFTDVAVSFVLPAGVELVSAPEEWRVDMDLNQTYVFTATARVLENGYYKIVGSGRKDTPYGSSFPGFDALYVLVEGEDTWVSHYPPPNHWESPRQEVPGATPLQPELIQNRLYLSGTLTLNQPVTLVYEVTPLVDLQIATVGIAVPVGGLQSSEPRAEASDTTLITPLKFHSSTEGVYYWNGSMKGQQTYSFYITLEPTAGGESVVDASVNESGTVDSVTRPVIATSQSLTLTLYSPQLAR